jgi:hypothetical protein
MSGLAGSGIHRRSSKHPWRGPFGPVGSADRESAPANGCPGPHDTFARMSEIRTEKSRTEPAGRRILMRLSQRTLPVRMRHTRRCLEHHRLDRRPGQLDGRAQYWSSGPGCGGLCGASPVAAGDPAGASVALGDGEPGTPGPGAAGSGAAEPEAAGSGAAEPEAAGPGAAGPGAEGSGAAEPGAARPGAAGVAGPGQAWAEGPDGWPPGDAHTDGVESGAPGW